MLTLRDKLIGAALLAGLVATVAGGVWWHGYRAGVSAEAERHAAATRELNDRLRRAEEARRAATEAFLRERRRLSDLEREVGDVASTDPDADRVCYSHGVVRSLNAVR